MLTVHDFILKEKSEDWASWTTGKEIIFLGKPFNNRPLELSIHTNHGIEDVIDKINDYMEWLAKDTAKDILMAGLCDHVNEYDSVTPEELNEINWFETLQVYRVLLTITADGRVGVDFSCGDNYDKGHLLDMGLLEQEVVEVGYDG